MISHKSKTNFVTRYIKTNIYWFCATRIKAQKSKKHPTLSSKTFRINVQRQKSILLFSDHRSQKREIRHRLQPPPYFPLSYKSSDCYALHADGRSLSFTINTLSSMTFGSALRFYADCLLSLTIVPWISPLNVPPLMMMFSESSLCAKYAPKKALLLSTFLVNVPALISITP